MNFSKKRVFYNLKGNYNNTRSMFSQNFHRNIFQNLHLIFCSPIYPLHTWYFQFQFLLFSFYFFFLQSFLYNRPVSIGLWIFIYGLMFITYTAQYYRASLFSLVCYISEFLTEFNTDSKCKQMSYLLRSVLYYVEMFFLNPYPNNCYVFSFLSIKYGMCLYL